MKKSIIFSAVAALGLAGYANAAQITLDASVDAAFSAANESNPGSYVYVAGTHTATTSGGNILEIPVTFMLSNLAAGQSFGNVSVNVTLSGGLYGNVVDGPYFPASPSYLNGKQTVLYYGGNSDAGLSQTDLQSIVAYFPAGVATAQRSTAGVGSPFALGQIYVGVPAGFTSGDVVITPTQLSENNSTGVVITDPTPTLTSVTIHVAAVAVPEPASLGLLGTGALGLLARRRRQA